MPSLHASHPCQHPLCPNLVPPGMKYCPAHAADEPPRACGAPGCKALVQWPNRYCPAHTKKSATAGKHRKTTRARGYGPEWERARKMKLARDPHCQECLRTGRLRNAVDVHHVDHNTRNVADRNLLSVCRRCHARLERAYRRQQKADAWFRRARRDGG